MRLRQPRPADLGDDAVLIAPAWSLVPALEDPPRLSGREWRRWPVTDLPVLLVALVALVALPSHQSFDPAAACVLVALFVVAYNVKVPLGHGEASGVQPVFVAMLVLEPARVAALLVLAASAVAELIEIGGGRRPAGRLPKVIGNCWFALSPTIIVALAPAQVPWQWWAAAFLAQFATDVVMMRVRDRLTSSTPAPFRAIVMTELFDCIVTLPVLFTCLQARGQPAAWAVPVSLVAMSALFARERTGRMANEQLASEDPLTGLPNRRLFERLLGDAHARAERAGRDGAVLIVDLDRFKQVNDALGHLAGDEVLREAARRLNHVVRTGDVVARLGGDEFALLLCDSDGAGRVALAIEAAFADPIRAGAQRCDIGVSVGAATFGRGTPAAEALERADGAMYAVKRTAGLHGGVAA
jgi:diguanylate cyclase (GGDEF)-like protein